MCLSTFNWQFCWFLSYFLTTDFQKYLIVKIAYTSIVFLPFILYHFVVRFLNLWATRARIVKLFYAVSGCFLVILWATDLYMAGYYQFRWGIYGRAGVLHPAYLALVAVAIWEFIRMLAKAVADRATSAVEHNRAKFTLASFVLFSCAAVEYLINYGVGFYPIGVFFILGSFSVIFYAITRHRLMDINLAIWRTWVFTLVYTLTLGLPLLLALAWRSKLEQVFGINWWVGLWFVCASLATAAHYANLHFQHRIDERLLAEERKAHDALEQISKNMMRFLKLKSLLGQIVRQLIDILELTHAGVYLANNKPGEEGGDGSFERKAAWHRPARKDTTLPASLPVDSALLKDLQSVGLARVREEIRLQQEGISPHWRGIVEDMDRLQASVVIPAYHERRLLGFVVLGEKRSGRIWTQADLNILTVLANQAALAIENAQFYEEEEQRAIERERERTAWDLTEGISHQYSNRFQVLDIMLAYLQGLLKNGKFEKVNEMMEQVVMLREECKLGGEISHGIMALATADPKEFKPTEIPPVIELAINFVKFLNSRDAANSGIPVPEIQNGVPKTLPPVLCLSSHIHTCFSDVLNNAADAIREKIHKARLKLIPPLPESYQGLIQVKGEERNGKLVFTIEDNGIGIREEDKHKILDVSHFTTKATGVKGHGAGGHGIGLYFIKRILRAHKGSIRFESEWGKGTRITIELPVWEWKERAHGG